MDYKTLNEANRIKEKINECKSFIDAFSIATKFPYIKSFGRIKIKTERSVSIIGTRFMSLPRDKEIEIEIPFDMVQEVQKLFINKLGRLEDEFRELKL